MKRKGKKVLHDMREKNFEVLTRKKTKKKKKKKEKGVKSNRRE